MAPIQPGFWGILSQILYFSSKNERYYTCIVSMCLANTLLSSFKIFCFVVSISPPPLIGWAHKQVHASQILLLVSTLSSFLIGAEHNSFVFLAIAGQPGRYCCCVAGCLSAQGTGLHSVLATTCTSVSCDTRHSISPLVATAAQQQEQVPTGTDFLSLLTGACDGGHLADRIQEPFSAAGVFPGHVDCIVTCLTLL